MNNYISIAPLYEGDYLAHHGIGGMKWGVMHGPPYPLARGKGGKLPKIKKIVKSRQSKEEKQAAKRALKAEEKKEALKKNIIEHPGKLYKYKDMFTKDELEELIGAINFDQRLKDVKRNNFKKTVDTVKDVAILATSVKNIATSAVDTYKAAQNISDILQKKGAFSDKKDSTSGSDDKKSEAKKESSPTPESKKSEPKKDSSASPSINEPKNTGNRMDDDYFTKGNRNDFKVSSSNRSDASSGITSDDSKSKKKDQKYARREAAGFSFLERLGLADPSTYR